MRRHGTRTVLNSVNDEGKLTTQLGQRLRRPVFVLQVSPLVAHDNDWGGGFVSDADRVALNTLRLAPDQATSESSPEGSSDNGR